MLSKSDTTQLGSTKAWIFVGILAGGHTLYHWVVQGFIVVLPEVQHHFFEQHWGRVNSYCECSSISCTNLCEISLRLRKQIWKIRATVEGVILKRLKEEEPDQ